MNRPDASLLVIAGGVSAALHVGKLPPALPALGEAFGLSLVQAGFLLSLVQLAGMALGLAVGLAADAFGLKRTMVTGLLVLSSAGFAGGWARDVPTLLVLRAVEGLGFLLASMPAPALIRRLVTAQRLAPRLGFWGAYMPLGTATALLVGPMAIGRYGWAGWWWMVSAASLGSAVWIALAVPAGAPHLVASRPGNWPRAVALTLSSPGPWLVALCFAMYSGQWLAVIGFLPSVYAQAGFTGPAAGVATALAAAVNIVGNVGSGWLLQRGVPAHRLLFGGFVAMGLGSLVAFAPLWPAAPALPAALLKYVAVLVFSLFGGLIPGTLFTLAVRLAPSEHTVSSTVGWMQQCSAVGQFAGPPLVGWIAGVTGGWQWSWLVTCGCAVCGLCLSRRLRELATRPDAERKAHGHSPKI